MVEPHSRLSTGAGGSKCSPGCRGLLDRRGGVDPFRAQCDVCQLLRLVCMQQQRLRLKP